MSPARPDQLEHEVKLTPASDEITSPRQTAANSDSFPMTVIALDGRVELAEAAERLRWPELRRYGYGSVYTVDDLRVYLFRFGAIVVEGSSRIDESTLRVIQSAVGRSVLPDTMESYSVKVEPARAGDPRIGWDQVVVPERSHELISAVALLIGQSAALERYEKAAQPIIDEALTLSRSLANRGTVPRATPAQVRLIGRLTSIRLELASLFYLLDRPEETWDDPQVAKLHDGLFNNLELHSRHQAMLQKFALIETVTDVVMATRQNIISTRLEWAIVILIVLEILLALLGKV